MGRPKAWLDFGGSPLLARVVATLSAAASPLVVVAAPGQDVPPLPSDVELLRDPVEGRGPLQGIAVGLAAVGNRAPYAYVSAGDTPLLCAAFVERVAALATGYDAAVPQLDGRMHPLSAVYATRLATSAEQLLADGRGSARSLVDACRARVVDRELLLADAGLRAADPDLHSLDNVNTPADYERALRQTQR
jgi:molybdopterin-guanine dinucleotide biosynthesis protein A